MYLLPPLIPCQHEEEIDTLQATVAMLESRTGLLEAEKVALLAQLEAEKVQLLAAKQSTHLDKRAKEEMTQMLDDQKEYIGELEEERRQHRSTIADLKNQIRKLGTSFPPPSFFKYLFGQNWRSLKWQKVYPEEWTIVKEKKKQKRPRKG